jgi:2-methylcitrate dehydratase PrpD
LHETLQLADHVASLRFEDVPTPLIEELKVLTLDYLGVALRGSLTDSARIVAGFQTEYGAARPEATIIGSGAQVSAQAAAFANAVAAHSIELDDVDDLALFHFSPPVLSAALAATEAAGLGGKGYLLAAAAGSEVMARVSNAANPAMRDRGFHSTATCGVFGAAAAAARVEGLSPEQVASTFGIAGAHAAGLMEMYGPSMQKRINPGPAAQNGVVAARLARRGYTGADTIFEGERGVLKAFTGGGDPRALVDRLGTEYPVRIEYKAYACARPIHNAVDCALELRRQVAGRLAEIRELTIYRHPAWAHYHQIRSPRSHHEAQVSLNHAVAVALVEGAAFLDQFQEEFIALPEVQRLSRMLQFEADPGLSRGVSCNLRVKLDSGESFEAQVDYPKGSLQNPMTPEDHWRKFLSLAGTRFPTSRLDAIRDAVAHLEDVAGIGELTALLAD